MSDRPKPIRVKSISDEIIWYGGERKRRGDVFFIDLPMHFSKAGKMVMLDGDGNEIRHKGGFKHLKNDKGEVIKVIPMKGEPVVPDGHGSYEVMQPTQEEIEDQERAAAYEKELADLKKKYQKEPKPEVAKVEEVI